MDTDFEEKCRQAGVRLTAKRLLVLRFFQPGEHLDAEELHRRVARIDPRLSRGTIYRTLRELASRGLLAEHSLVGA